MTYDPTLPADFDIYEVTTSSYHEAFEIIQGLVTSNNHLSVRSDNVIILAHQGEIQGDHPSLVFLGKNTTSEVTE